MLTDLKKLGQIIENITTDDILDLSEQQLIKKCDIIVSANFVDGKYDKIEPGIKKSKLIHLFWDVSSKQWKEQLSVFHSVTTKNITSKNSDGINNFAKKYKIFNPSKKMFNDIQKYLNNKQKSLKDDKVTVIVIAKIDGKFPAQIPKIREILRNQYCEKFQFETHENTCCHLCGRYEKVAHKTHPFGFFSFKKLNFVPNLDPENLHKTMPLCFKCTKTISIARNFIDLISPSDPLKFDNFQKKIIPRGDENALKFFVTEIKKNLLTFDISFARKLAKRKNLRLSFDYYIFKTDNASVKLETIFSDTTPSIINNINRHIAMVCTELGSVDKRLTFSSIPDLYWAFDDRSDYIKFANQIFQGKLPDHVCTFSCDNIMKMLTLIEFLAILKKRKRKKVRTMIDKSFFNDHEKRAIEIGEKLRLGPAEAFWFVRGLQWSKFRGYKFMTGHSMPDINWSLKLSDVSGFIDDKTQQYGETRGGHLPLTRLLIERFQTAMIANTHAFKLDSKTARFYFRAGNEFKTAIFLKKGKHDEK